MTGHYTAPEMFIFTDTKFKQELNTQNINRKKLKKHSISIVVDGGRALFVQPRKRNQWMQRRAIPGAGFDKG